MAPLSDWENFYVIIGSSAAALTGLMFVVITLVTGSRNHSSGEGLMAFGTPNVVHFCVALFTSAALSAPWQALWPIELLLGLTSLAGVGYVILTALRARRQSEYQPVFEDWLFHVALPFVAYLAILITVVLLPGDARLALFAVAGATVLLLFIGIHNAWDTVTYFAVQVLPSEQEKQESQD